MIVIVIKGENAFSRDVGAGSASYARPVQSQEERAREDVGGVPELHQVGEEHVRGDGQGGRYGGGEEGNSAGGRGTGHGGVV